MAALIRDSTLGQIIRWGTGNKVLQYPEERPDFQCPMSYAEPDAAAKVQKEKITSPSSTSAGISTDDPADIEKAGMEPVEPAEESAGLDREGLERVETSHSALERAETVKDLEKSATLRSTLSRTATKAALQQSHTRADLEAAFTAASLAKPPTQAIIPARTEDGTILVDWYDTDDPENPQNWSQGKKAFTSLLICLYTLAFYMGSAIYTSSAGGVMKVFGVGPEVASLGLSLYVLAYGLGPLLFSPLSEIPSIGRNPPYMVSFGIFVILCIPTALVDNIAGLLVLRFLQGFFGSPCLATGGASLQDMYSLIKLPYILCLWAFAATCGPALVSPVSS